MAKISAKQKHLRKQKTVAQKADKRAELVALIKNRETPMDDRLAAVAKLSELPRDSSKTRLRNRCEITGRPRSYYRKFKMSRIALRELGSQGLIPGLTKSSW